MINRFLVILGALAGGFLHSGAALAQDCSIIYEEISTLRKPEFGAYNIWSTERGDVDAQETYRSGFLEADGAITLAGEREREGRNFKELSISKIGQYGRVSLEIFHEVAGLERVIKILPYEKGSMVLADIRTDKRRDEIWIGFFDMFGKLTRHKIIADKKAALHAFDIIPDQSGKKYILAATSARDDFAQSSSSVLYVLDASAKTLSSTGFVLGTENQITSLSLYGKEGYVASGYSYSADGRRSGWIMRLDNALKIMWQQVYPRGAGSELVKSAPMPGHAIAVVGTSAPGIKNGLRAGWVMQVEAAGGDVIWQRFYSSDVHYAGRDMMVSKDGLLSVVLDGDAVPNKPEAQQHAQLLTLNGRGIILASDTFYNGDGVDLYAMTEGPAHERILIGRTLISHQVAKKQAEGEAAPKPGEPKFDVKRSQEGWVLAASGPTPYKDPCLQTVTTLP